MCYAGQPNSPDVFTEKLTHTSFGCDIEVLSATLFDKKPNFYEGFLWVR
jgi:hypothetical protein